MLESLILVAKPCNYISYLSRIQNVMSYVVVHAQEQVCECSGFLFYANLKHLKAFGKNMVTLLILFLA